MRRGEQAQRFEFVQTERIEAGDRLSAPAPARVLRSHRLPGLQIAFHHQTEDLARAVGQFGDRRAA
jgi:hypothetical protein